MRQPLRQGRGPATASVRCSPGPDGLPASAVGGAARFTRTARQRAWGRSSRHATPQAGLACLYGRGPEFCRLHPQGGCAADEAGKSRLPHSRFIFLASKSILPENRCILLQGEQKSQRAHRLRFAAVIRSCCRAPAQNGKIRSVRGPGSERLRYISSGRQRYTAMSEQTPRNFRNDL